MTLPNVFVGTLYCNEGDFHLTKDAIINQQSVNVTHVVISNLPEMVAHNALWNSWRVNKEKHDMFVKVDADTVLAHNNVLIELWNIMSSNQRITGIQSPLHDYFTDDFINGLNCFSPKVRFLDSKDDLFCDRKVDVDHDVVLKANDVPQILRPSGFHCYHATPIQAFHFGLHRALKRQFDVINKVINAWKKHGSRQDDVRIHAIKGAQISHSVTKNLSYTDTELQKLFDDVQQVHIT